MTDHLPNHSLARLAPAIAGYATARFRLADDLVRLERVRSVEAPEAAVLYSARVLEALAADALAAIDLPPSASLFSNLGTLESLNLIPAATSNWAHALRRMGNLVRHIHSRVETEDAELGGLFLERWLEWFFGGFRYGHRLTALTVDGIPFGLSNDANSRELMHLLEADGADLAAAIQRMDPNFGGKLPTSPTLPAVLVELLLNRGDHAAAEGLLVATLELFPDDLRLRQLQGLYLSRTGRLSEALDWLEPLHRQYRDDEETAGITAGVYKRAWFKDPARLDWLESSHRAYRQAWGKSKHSNSYVGINAATTSLWLGRPDESRKTAQVVRESLLSQSAALSKFSSDQDLAFNFWQQMTFVEADLLLGDLTAARDRFRRIEERNGDRQRSSIEVARKQFDAIVRAMGPSFGTTEFLATA